MQFLRCPFILFLISRFLGVAVSWEAPLFRGTRIPESELDDLSKKAQLMSKHDEPGSMPIVNGCPTCSKTFSESCPFSWEFQAGEACHAPSGYSGYCARGLKFVGWSVESKIVAEMSCSICWPCSDAPVSNDAAAIE